MSGTAATIAEGNHTDRAKKEIVRSLILISEDRRHRPRTLLESRPKFVCFVHCLAAETWMVVDDVGATPYSSGAEHRFRRVRPNSCLARGSTARRLPTISWWHGDTRLLVYSSLPLTSHLHTSTWENLQAPSSIRPNAQWEL
jgi:hypothetical protein